MVDDGPADDTTVVPAHERGERFGRLIRSARINADLSQDELAQRTGFSRSQLIRWESGRAERPDPPTVRAVCRFLGIDPREGVIALGYLTREEAYGEPKLSPQVEEVVRLLEDPTVPEEEKTAWVRYLRYLRDKAIHELAGVQTGLRIHARGLDPDADAAADAGTAPAEKPQAGAVMRTGHSRSTSKSTSKVTTNPTTSVTTRGAVSGRFVSGTKSGRSTTKPASDKPAPPGK